MARDHLPGVCHRFERYGAVSLETEPKSRRGALQAATSTDVPAEVSNNRQNRLRRALSPEPVQRVLVNLDSKSRSIGNVNEWAIVFERIDRKVVANWVLGTVEF